MILHHQDHADERPFIRTRDRKTKGENGREEIRITEPLELWTRSHWFRRHTRKDLETANVLSHLGPNKKTSSNNSGKT